MSWLQVATLIIKVARKVHDQTRNPAEVEAANRILDAALMQSAKEASPDADGRQAAYDAVLALLTDEEAGEVTWLLRAAEQDNDDYPEIPGYPGVVHRFRELLEAGMRDEAARPNSPLFQLVALDYLVEIRNTVAEARPAMAGPPDSIDAGIDTSELPPVCGTLLRQIDGRTARTCVEALQNEAYPEADRVAHLLTESPTWLMQAPWEVWVALGEHAIGHGNSKAAIGAFSGAAERNEGSRARWLTRAAIAVLPDLEAFDRYVAGARASSPTPDQLRYVDFAIAARSNDRRRILDAARLSLAEGTPEPLGAALAASHMLELSGNLDDAINLLRPHVEANPSSAGAHLVLARQLLLRADAEHSTTRDEDARDAKRHALTARDLRRRWRGDSGEPAGIACNIAALQGDWLEVIRLGTPDSDATIEEAENPIVRRTVTFAQVNLDQKIASTDPVAVAISEGLAHLQSGQTSDAIERLTYAAETADDHASLSVALRFLARAGADELPRLNELYAIDPPHADTLKAYADLQAEREPAALATLRALARTERLAANLLSNWYAEREAFAEAAAVVDNAGERFAEPKLLIEAAHLHERSGDRNAAEDAINRGLLRAANDSNVRRRLRRLALQIAMEKRDLPAIERAARAVLTDGEEHLGVRWTLVEVLMHRRRLREAWSELNADPRLTPDTRDHAETVLQLQARAAPERIEMAADILDAYPDDHDLRALGCTLFLSTENDTEAADEAAIERMKAHVQRLVDDQSDGSGLRKVEISLEPGEALDSIGRHLPDEPSPEIQQLIDRVTLGQLPFGLLAESMGRLYVPSLLAVDCIGFACTPSSDEDLERQVRYALDALDGPAVLDPSALMVMSFIPDLWRHLSGSFFNLSMTPRGHAAVDELIFHRPDAGRVHRDSATGLIRVQSHQDDAVVRTRERRGWIRDRAYELDWADEIDLPEELAAMDPDAMWPDALAAAKATDAALWVDDPATAQLAWSEGVPAFGTIALLAALRHLEEISNDAHGEATQALFLAQAYDLPIPTALLPVVAKVTGWKPGPSVAQLGRPHRWIDSVPDSLEAAAIIARGLKASGHDGAVPEIVHTVVSGLLRALPPEEGADIAGSLIADLNTALDLEPEVVANALAAARHACGAYNAPDPLISAINSILAAAEMNGSENPEGAVRHLLSTLDERDRQMMSARLAGEDVPARSAREVIRDQIIAAQPPDNLPSN